jgi:hypothetical protein
MHPTDTERIPGQLDVDVLALVVRDEGTPATTALSGELVAPADELVQAFAATLVARPQTQRTYERACGRFARWLGPLAGPEDLTAANVPAAPCAAGWPRAGARRPASCDTASAGAAP